MKRLPDREQRLLALLIAADPNESPFSAEFEGGAGQIDWARFEELVKRHRVSALVYAGSLVANHIALPDALHDRLARATSANAQDYMRAVQVASQLTASLGKVGIGCAVLKGVVVAARYYDQPSGREMIDIDLLVDSARYDDAEAIVLQAGFERFYPKFSLSEQTRASFFTLHNAFTYIRREDGLQIDLHWRMVQNPVMLAGLDRSWTELIEDNDAAGLTLPMLTPSAHALYIAVHGAKHGWVRLKWLADIDRVLRGLEEDELSQFVRLAQANGLGRLLAATIKLSAGIFGTLLRAELRSLADSQDCEQIIGLQLQMIWGEQPAREHRISDSAHFLRRIRHSLLLHEGKGYRRHAMLRELGRPQDLEHIQLAPRQLWLLPTVSPILGIWRAIWRK